MIPALLSRRGPSPSAVVSPIQHHSPPQMRCCPYSTAAYPLPLQSGLRGKAQWSGPSGAGRLPKPARPLVPLRFTVGDEATATKPHRHDKAGTLRGEIYYTLTQQYALIHFQERVNFNALVYKKICNKK